MHPAGSERLRPAVPADASVLDELAVRSKAHWGYDTEFLEAAREELRVARHNIDRETVVVAVLADSIVGFAEIDGTTDDDAELLSLFVEPSAIGTGVGARLFDEAVEVARGLGLTRFVIHSDPFAAGFYERMGAKRVGDAASGSIPGRTLPVFVYDFGLAG